MFLPSEKWLMFGRRSHFFKRIASVATQRFVATSGDLSATVCWHTGRRLWMEKNMSFHMANFGSKELTPRQPVGNLSPELFGHLSFFRKRNTGSDLLKFQWQCCKKKICCCDLMQESSAFHIQPGCTCASRRQRVNGCQVRPRKSPEDVFISIVRTRVNSCARVEVWSVWMGVLDDAPHVHRHTLQ